MSTLTVGIRDYSREIGRASFNVAVASTDTGADLDALEAAARAAIDPITLGVIAQTSILYPGFEDEGVPADQFAQREMGLRILMIGDQSDRNFSVTIPAPDLNVLTLQGNTDDVELADAGVMAALVAWLEANVEYPFGAAPGTEGVTVTRAYVVGRNN